MGVFNPVYIVTAPFIFLVTVPLAIFAGITTTLAFSVLILRVFFIYVDVALSLVPESLLGLKPRYLRYRPRPHHATAAAISSSSPSRGQLNRTPSPVGITSQPPHMIRRRRRRPSSASTVSAESATSVILSGSAGPGTSAGDGSWGLIPSVGPERDFEGLGGWRTGGQDDETWTTINSRLEMPDRHHARNHYRSASGGATTPGEGSYLMMKGRVRTPDAMVATRPTSTSSPNSSRARTPTGHRVAFTPAAGSGDGYFSYVPSPKANKKTAVHGGG